MTTSKLTFRFIILTTIFLLADCNTFHRLTGKSYTEKIKGEVEIIDTKTNDKSNGKIFGTVTDKKTGELLKQANILVLGTDTGTTTNEKGEFEIEVTGKTTLQFSYVGLKTLDKNFNVKPGQELKIDVRIGTETIHDRW